MEILYLFCFSFLVVYLLYLLSVVLFKSKYYLFKKGKLTQLFIKKYNLKFKNISEEQFYNLISVVNSLIISVTFCITFIIDGLLYKMLLAFFIFIPLLLITYILLGKYIKKKEGK